MIKKIILGSVFVAGISAPAQATIKVDAKVVKVLSLATTGVAIAEGVKSAGLCFSPPFSTIECLKMVGNFGTAGLSLVSAQQAHNTECQSASSSAGCIPSLTGSEFDGSVFDSGLNTDGFGGDFPAGSFSGTSVPEGGTVGDLQNVVRENLDKAEEKGFVFNPETNSISSPDGKTTSLASLGSASGSGASLAADSKKAEALVEKYKKHFGITGSSNDGFSNIGGGSSYADNYSSDDYDDDYSSNLNNLLGKLSKKDKRKPASVKGLVKNVGNGDAIGVAGDNIFEMIARGYKHKIETKQLIGN